MFLTTSQDFWQELNISSRNIKNEKWSKCSLRSQRVGVSLCFWPLHKISGRNWTFRAEIQKMRIDRNIRCNLKESRFPYVSDHFPRFVADTEHFEQKSQKRELIDMSYLPKETLCFWPLPTISGRNWTFRAEISKTRTGRHVIFTEGNLTFLTTSQDFCQKMNIPSKTRNNDNWSTCHIYRRKPYVFDHFPRFLTETEHF